MCLERAALDLANERHVGTRGRLCADARSGAHTGRRMDRVEVCGETRVCAEIALMFELVYVSKTRNRK